MPATPQDSQAKSAAAVVVPPQAGEPPAPGSAGGTLDVSLAPSELEVTLEQPSEGAALARFGRPWHRPKTPPAARITLVSHGDEPRRARLAIRGEAAGWQSRWVRLVPDRLAGEQTEWEGQDLVLSIPPGGRRMAYVEGVARLDGGTYAGDYPFGVLVTDLENGECASARGELHLRHPLTSLLRYLPAIYSAGDGRRPGQPYEDPPFFTRFLRGFEDALAPFREIIDQLHRLADAEQAPAEFLPWLATWVALVLEEDWPEQKRRELIREAPELYRWRGTRRGLARYIEIYTGHTPEISDHPFEGMRLGADARLGMNAILGSVPPHTFVVTLTVPDPDAVNENVVRAVIEAQKPAHAAYDLRIMWQAAGTADGALPAQQL